MDRASNWRHRSVKSARPPIRRGARWATRLRERKLRDVLSLVHAVRALYRAGLARHRSAVRPRCVQRAVSSQIIADRSRGPSTRQEIRRRAGGPGDTGMGMGA